jgi:hypothetical protein
VAAVHRHRHTVLLPSGWLATAAGACPARTPYFNNNATTAPRIRPTAPPPRPAQAKWVAYRLWIRAKDYFDRQQPKEKRILEYLMQIADPLERSAQLDKAVTPGPEHFGDTHDYFWTTPARLFAVLDGTLRAYEEMRAAAEKSLAQEDSNILPRKVRVMRDLRQEIMRRYL